MLWTTPQSLQEEQPLTSAGTSSVLTADARIDNREELIEKLTIMRVGEFRPTDAELIMAAYQRWGVHCPEQLIGDFAFALWDSHRRQLFCARDPLGVRGFYYHYRPQRLFVFATEIKALFKGSEVPRELNEARVADYLAFIFDDLESTFYRDIQRLPPGHCLVVSSRGLSLRRYWAFDPERELVLGSDAEYEDAFRELLTEAVRCRLRSAFPVGSTLSGGLDSSSIACVAQDLLKATPTKKLHTFSAIFPSLPKQDLRFIDERGYMEAVLATGDFDAHWLRADRLSPTGDLDSVLWQLDEPHTAFNLYLHRGLYQSASSCGVRVLLDGFDGDTTVSYGHERLAELALTLRWLTLLKETRALSWHFPNPGILIFWKLIRAHALEPILPPSLKRAWQRFRHPMYPPWGPNCVIDTTFARRMGLEERIHSLRNVHAPPFRGARKAHLQGLSSPLLAVALEVADKCAAAFQLDARYPFFDRRLMEYCLAVPADQKLRQGWSRSLLRRSMQSLLPSRVQWRRTKGNLGSNFHRGLSNSGLRSIDQVLNTDGQSARHLIDLAALKKIYERYQGKPSDADGMTLFNVITLLHWLQTSGILGFARNSRT